MKIDCSPPQATRKSTIGRRRRPENRLRSVSGDLTVDYTAGPLTDNCLWLSCRHVTARGRRRAHIYRESGRTSQGRWVARNQHESPRLSAKGPQKFGISFTQVLHRSYAVCSPVDLTVQVLVASARTWRGHSTLLCSNQRVAPLGRERGQATCCALLATDCSVAIAQ